MQIVMHITEPLQFPPMNCLKVIFTFDDDLSVLFLLRTQQPWCNDNARTLFGRGRSATAVRLRRAKDSWQ
jgi:hypothetical protein